MKQLIAQQYAVKNTQEDDVGEGPSLDKIAVQNPEERKQLD